MNYDKIEREIEWLLLPNPFDHPNTCEVEKSAAQSLRLLLDVARAAERLQIRCAHHFSGTYDWKEQEEVRDALTALKEHCDD